MPIYFHGCRRKIGVMTLVMACVFLTPWVRSMGTWPVGEGHKFSLEFMESRVDFRVDHLSDISHDGYTSTHLFKFSAPYWAIVIPLTLLSAYLLLRNPRRPKPESTHV